MQNNWENVQMSEHVRIFEKVLKQYFVIPENVRLIYSNNTVTCDSHIQITQSIKNSRIWIREVL